MDDAVSNALHARTHAPEGLTKMLLASVAAHVVLVTLASVAPASLWRRPVDVRSSFVTIDLGPSAGQETGGRTPSGAPPVQRAVSSSPAVQPSHPPAARTPESLPADVVPRKPAPTVSDAPQDARGRTATTGDKVLPGNGSAASAVQTNGSGISTTPNGAGTGVQVNVGDFCCPDYIATMVQRIHQHWIPGRGATGVTTMQLTIQRDGAITDVQMVRSSGNEMQDFLAKRALLAVRQLPPLPDAYTNPALIISLEFQYQH